MPSHNNSTPTTRKAQGCSSTSCPSKRSVLPQSGSMSTGTRTVGGSNVSRSGSVVNIPLDDGSLQHQRLAEYEAQRVLDDGNAYARCQDSTSTTTANRDEAARIAFHQTRAAEAIHQFNNTFNRK